MFMRRTAHPYRLIVLPFAAALVLVACDNAAGPGSPADSGADAHRAEGAVDLRPGFSRTDALTYEHTMESRESRTAAPGGPVVAEAQIVRQFTVQPVAQTPDGGAMVEFTMRRVAIALRMSGGDTINIDTDRLPTEIEDPQARTIRALAALRIILAMNADGSVSEVRGLQEALQGIGPLPEGMSAFFSEDWFRAAVEGVWRAAEDRVSADVGDEWTIAKSSPFFDSPDAATTTFTSRLTFADDASAVIEGAATLDIDFSRTSMAWGGESTIDDQMFDYQKRWDLARGALLEQTTIQRAQMTVYMGGLRVGVDQTTASRLARLSPDGVPSALQPAESPGTQVNPDASESDSP